MKREVKDSGIEWIGEIPKDWGISKAKHLFLIKNGATPNSGVLSYWDGEIPWVTPADYKTEDIYISNPKRSITENGLNSCGTSIVPEGSIIISNRAPIGHVGIAKYPLCTNQGCKSLIKNANIIEKFYYYFFFGDE